MAEHTALPVGEIHVAHQWAFADATARQAAVFTDPEQLDKLALQLDDGSYWRLAAVAPAEWVAVTQAASRALALPSGAALVGTPDGGTLDIYLRDKASRVVASIAALRTIDATQYANVFATGYYAPGDGGGGAYWYDAADHASADNGGTIIVGLNGARWKLVGLSTWINVRQFGAKGDGVTDDSAAIQAAVTAARYGVCFVPPGKYLASNIIAQNVEIIGFGGKNSVLPYGIAGTTFYVTDVAHSVFYLGRGASLRNVKFYYPNQDGAGIDVSLYPVITGAPIVYPPTIATYHPAGAGASAIEITGCTAYNAYDFIELGDGAAVVGRVLIDGCEAFCLNRFVRARNATGLVELTHTFASVAVFQSVAIVGNQALGKWAQRNAVFLTLGKTSGVHLAHGIAYGFRKAFVATDDIASQNQFGPFAIDSTPIAVSLENGGYFNTTSFANMSFYCMDRYYSGEDLAAFNFSSAPVLTTDNETSFTSITLEACQGEGFAITGDCVRKLSIIDGRLKNWGSGDGMAGKRAIYRTDGAGVIHLVGTFFENSCPQGVGIEQTTGFKLSMKGLDFDGCYQPIRSTAGGSIICEGNTSNGSTSPPRLSATNVAPHHNIFDRYEPVVRHTRPAFYAKAGVGQLFNSNVATPVSFATEVYDRGNNYDPGTSVFTAPISGEYVFTVQLGHDGTATPGDVWNVRLVTTSDTLLYEYRVPAATSLTAGFSVQCEMVVGDTAYVDVSRSGGAGQFQTQANGNVNRFQGRLIE